MLPLRGKAPADVLAALREYVDELDTAERFLLIKLIGGGFRVGVSRLLITRALAEHSGLDAKVIAQRMIGFTDISVAPSATRYLSLIESVTRCCRRHPIHFLAHACRASSNFCRTRAAGGLDVRVEYDGIRAQLASVPASVLGHAEE